MGGFVLAQNGIPIQAMSYSKSWFEQGRGFSAYISKHGGRRDYNYSDGIKELILAGIIDAPNIPKAEIQDRSKGNIISKTVVILQDHMVHHSVYCSVVGLTYGHEIGDCNTRLCNSERNHICTLVAINQKM